MFIVLRASKGDFTLPADFAKKYNLPVVHSYIDRSDPRLVRYMKKHMNKRGYYKDLRIVEIPNNSTDHITVSLDHEDEEFIFYVVNGIIYKA